MNCPHCGANIEKEIDVFVESMALCFGFIFVCPACKKTLGVRVPKNKKEAQKNR